MNGIVIKHASSAVMSGMTTLFQKSNQHVTNLKPGHRHNVHQTLTVIGCNIYSPEYIIIDLSTHPILWMVVI